MVPQLLRQALSGQVPGVAAQADPPTVGGMALAAPPRRARPLPSRACSAPSSSSSSSSQFPFSLLGLNHSARDTFFGGKGITHFFGVPAPYQFMVQHADFASTDLSRLRRAGVGGAPCALAILQAWADRGVRLMQGFGMTETSPACISLAEADALRKQGSTGKVLLHTEARIVDPSGADCAPGEIGELWVAGPNITPGYWNRPDATAAAFEGRWLKTGDAARQDEEGYFYIVDRLKDMYISGGENVYPAEVENVLYQLPEVAEAAVIGVPSAKWGEVGLAVLVLKPGQQIDKAAVLAFCAERLARFKTPHDIALLPALPRNATGKVLKRELRKQFVGSDAPAIS